ncbi:MAG TPA: asparagine synthase (glutamine-hydrolyzing) [Casimicrobiaceae bacterium]|jgi:asparagine synthase (glutamine-hydrolysing)
MCGICGIAWSDVSRPTNADTLKRMAGSLRHRGPDSEGFLVAPGVGLGFRRLSILDLKTGDQPISNEDGTVTVICNGEIYNYVELRQQLAAAGHRLSTSSDVEVIVHLYEEHGLDFVTHLRGMFALALWDAPRRRLVLARDRLGIKPLHYAITADGLFFGSEQKAILASGAVEPRPDVESLRQLFSYGRIVAPRTIVTGIRRLPAGHTLSWDAGRADIRQYWDASFPARDEYERRISEEEWADGLREKLDQSVRLHLRSDVPLGAWLSAGIDSSSVTALMSRLVPGPIQTFTLRFEDPEFDELRDQKGLDDYPQYGLAGHRIVCRDADMERLPKLIWHAEDALLGGIGVGQLMVAQATAAEVKVVLTGEGSDELLGGYPWYPTLRLLAPAFLLPQAVRRLIAGVPAIQRRWPGAAATIAGPREMNFERFSRSITHLRGRPDGSDVLAPEIAGDLGTEVEEGSDATPLPAEFETWHPFARMQYFDIKHRMGDGVVLGLDRTSMAYSVEARVPFLDHHVVEFCARIPPWVKVKWLREKHVLRRAMENVLPPDIVNRKKRGLDVPMDNWLRRGLPAFAAERMSASALRAGGYFDPDKVERLLKRHRAGEGNYGPILSAVLGVQVWHQLFRGGASSDLAPP